MRRPPDSRKARAGYSGLEKQTAIQDLRFLNSQSLGTPQAPLFTATPNGRHWQVKVVSAASAGVVYVGDFDSRLSALGAAVLMSAQCGGQVLP